MQPWLRSVSVATPACPSRPFCVLLLRHCPMPCIQAGGLDNSALRSAALLSNRLDIVATAAATAAKE